MVHPLGVADEERPKVGLPQQHGPQQVLLVQLVEISEGQLQAVAVVSADPQVTVGAEVHPGQALVREGNSARPTPK